MNRGLLTLLVLAGAAAGACSPMPQRVSEDPAAVAAYEARSRMLAPIDQWAIVGRLAISNGEEGGSGTLTWIQEQDGSRMNFRGTLGQGSWLLESDGYGARLQLADGREYTAADVGELVRVQVGWKVPVDALSWWVRGLAADGSWQQRLLDQAGRIIRLQQAGWEVNFGSYREHETLWLPSRLTAKRGAYTVKLIVREWDLGNSESALD